MRHYNTIPTDLRPLIAVAGCGGTGSQILVMLARLDAALRALGGRGIEVFCYDPDTVSAANCGRQVFYDSDLGRNKAEVLAERLRMCFPEFKIKGRPDKFRKLSCNVLISCVDSRRSRRSICSERYTNISYHIDCGNGADFGQVLLGNGTKNLPWPEVAEPDLVREGPEDDTPSCSMAEALEKQELFVNDYAARIAGTLLWNLFRHGYTEIRGAYFNLNPVMVNPIKIEDPPSPGLRRTSRPDTPDKTNKKKGRK